jgi:hypothetical protein
MSSSSLSGGHKPGFRETVRSDNWWVGPALTILVFLSFIVYATWGAFQGQHYWVNSAFSAETGEAQQRVDAGFGGYLSPFYSPVLFSKIDKPGAAPEEHAWFGDWSNLPYWPGFLEFSPAFLILIFPGAFRFTCYYYRKAYYRSFTGSPPGCAVGARPQGKYYGETRLLLFQNLHRYALYFAVGFVFILSWDAFQAFFRNGEFGIGVGSLVLTVNACLLAGYTFGCHSFRHLIGGKLNKFSCFAARHTAWQGCSWLNQRHMAWAWASLFWVAFTDIYVRLVSMGIWTDYNTWS